LKTPRAAGSARTARHPAFNASRNSSDLTIDAEVARLKRARARRSTPGATNSCSPPSLLVRNRRDSCARRAKIRRCGDRDGTLTDPTAVREVNLELQ